MKMKREWNEKKRFVHKCRFFCTFAVAGAATQFTANECADVEY